MRATIEKRNWPAARRPSTFPANRGAAKELARLIHSQAPAAPALRSGQLRRHARDLDGERVFGYRKGAFTSADSDREGLLPGRHRRYAVLDEVADLPLPMQVKLPRAIQEKRVRKVGSAVEEPVDVRVICATHKNLRECVDKGSFRQDLYYRLNVIPIAHASAAGKGRRTFPARRAILRRLGLGQPMPMTEAAADAWPVPLPRQRAGTGKHPGAGDGAVRPAIASTPTIYTWRRRISPGRPWGG